MTNLSNSGKAQWTAPKLQRLKTQAAEGFTGTKGDGGASKRS
jgi:hypothetical protein